MAEVCSVEVLFGLVMGTSGRLSNNRGTHCLCHVVRTKISNLSAGKGSSFLINFFAGSSVIRY